MTLGKFNHGGEGTKLFVLFSERKEQSYHFYYYFLSLPRKKVSLVTVTHRRLQEGGGRGSWDSEATAYSSRQCTLLVSFKDMAMLTLKIVN